MKIHVAIFWVVSLCTDVVGYMVSQPKRLKLEQSNFHTHSSTKNDKMSNGWNNSSLDTLDKCMVKGILNEIQVTYLPFISSHDSLPQCWHTGNDTRHVAKNCPPCYNVGIKLTSLLFRDWILMHKKFKFKRKEPNKIQNNIPIIYMQQAQYLVGYSVILCCCIQSWGHEVWQDDCA